MKRKITLYTILFLALLFTDSCKKSEEPSGGTWSFDSTNYIATSSPSSDSNQVIFSGKGGMILEKNGRPYKNDYVTVFEFEDDKIIRMYEYGDVFLYFNLRILH